MIINIKSGSYDQDIYNYGITNIIIKIVQKYRIKKKSY